MKLTESELIVAVDAAMVEMTNIHPPLRRSECQRLILAAIAAQPVSEEPIRKDEREQIAQHFDSRDAGVGGFYDPHEPAEIIRGLGNGSALAAQLATDELLREEFERGRRAGITEVHDSIRKEVAAAQSRALAAQTARRDDGMPTSADERRLRRLLWSRMGMSHTYYDDGEAQGTEHGISIDFMREPVADIEAKMLALNVARFIDAENQQATSPCEDPQATGSCTGAGCASPCGR